jgi:hypothetical protein
VTSAVVSHSVIRPGHIPATFYPALGVVTGVAVLGLLVALFGAARKETTR